MVLKRQLELEAIFFIMIGALVGYMFIHVQQSKQVAPIEIPVKAAEPTPTVAFIPTSSTVSQISSDGTKKVVIKITQNKDTKKTYEVSTADDGTAIFTQTLPADESLSIPFNTWSSDNSYFFINENTNAGTKTMVFQANGDPFASEENYLDLTGTFDQRNTGNTIAEVTGWAEGHLLIINTKSSDGTPGPSYWFEVPSKGIIPLSTKFL